MPLAKRPASRYGPCMKKTLILAAAILATSVLHAGAGATTTSTPILLQSGRLNILHGVQCAQTPFTYVAPGGGTTGLSDMAITATVQGGDTRVWVAAAAFRHSQTAGYPLAIQVCLNANNPDFVHGRWVYFTVAGVQS